MLRLAFLAANRLWPGLKALPAQAARALGGAVGNQPADNRRLPLNLAVILPVATLTWLGLPGITLVMSPSIDAWAVRRAPGPIGKGDLVEFMLSHPIAGPKPVSVTKRALCLPGERLHEIERPRSMAERAPAAGIIVGAPSSVRAAPSAAMAGHFLICDGAIGQSRRALSMSVPIMPGALTAAISGRSGSTASPAWSASCEAGACPAGYGWPAAPADGTRGRHDPPRLLVVPRQARSRRDAAR